MKWLITKEHQGKLIREFLMDIEGFSKRLLIKAKSAHNQIQVNGIHQTVRYVLQEGDMLTVTLPAEQIAQRMQAENLPLNIVYEDQYLLIIDKPAGVATIPSKQHPTGSVANRLLYYYQTKNLPYTVHIVTRLDLNTSGLVLVAKNQYSHSRLAALQKLHKIRRRYIAFVNGYVTKNIGTINKPIDRMEGSIIQRQVSDSGKNAVTHYRVQKYFDTFTQLDIELETGRTHQIRVHLAYIGHPLLGDDLYGGTLDNMNRQALHCREISFIHPFTGVEKVFNSRMPKDMAILYN